MAQAKIGDTVKVHYTGKLEDGTVLDSSINRGPLQFTLGESQVILGFEQAVVGMNLEESKTVNIPADEAYGPRHKELVVVVNRNEFPAELELKVDDHLQIKQADGQKILVTVTDISESSVTLDANHPLAGKDLTFDIQL
jgi:FKBP-type peptidyl-prolyl cis-trans isomerase 2